MIIIITDLYRSEDVAYTETLDAAHVGGLSEFKQMGFQVV